jgi:hypothetical protein
MNAIKDEPSSNPFVRILGHLVDLFWIFGLVPLLLLGCTVVLAPTLLHPVGKAEEYLDHLSDVIRTERHHATYLNASFGWHEPAWPYRVVTSVITVDLPEGDRGTNGYVKARQEREALVVRETPRDPDADSAGIKFAQADGMIGKFFKDNFWTALKLVTIIAATRLCYLVLIVGILVVPAYACWRIGFAIQRERRDQGIMPLGTRHKFSFFLAKMALCVMAAWPFVPWATPWFPSALVILALAFAALACLTWTASNYVEI